MKLRLIKLFLTSGFIALASLSYSLVMSSMQGEWPAHWPKELSRFRSSSETYSILTANQADVHVIPFNNSEDFENAWPHLLSLLSDGSKIEVTYASDDNTNGLYEDGIPCVRVSTPTKPVSTNLYDENQISVDYNTGQIFWPDYIYNESDQLPEYFALNKDETGEKLIPVSREEFLADFKSQKLTYGFVYRCRTDIEIVVDDDVINMDNIDIPTTVTLVYNYSTK